MQPLGAVTAAAVSLVSLSWISRIGHAGVVVEDGVHVSGAEVSVVVGVLESGAVAGGVAVLDAVVAGRQSRQPPPSGMFPSFFTSTWISGPGWGCS
jgi:hypothetical protein